MEADSFTPPRQTPAPDQGFSPYTPGMKSKGSLTPATGASPLASTSLPSTPVKGYSLATIIGVTKEYDAAAKIIGLLEEFAEEHSVLADVSAWLEEAWKRKVDTSVLRYTNNRLWGQSPFWL